jgi:hypothetical protein
LHLTGLRRSGRIQLGDQRGEQLDRATLELVASAFCVGPLVFARINDCRSAFLRDPGVPPSGTTALVAVVVRTFVDSQVISIAGDLDGALRSVDTFGFLRQICSFVACLTS